MKKISTLSGVAAPLPLANVDTDVIIRIEKLAQCPREQLGTWAFGALRYRDDGSIDPDFVLNRPPWQHAPILVAGPNFGCGSSREHAVWAMQGMGIECVIASSFGDIFRSNCFQNGLLPITLPVATVQQILALLEAERAQGRAVNIDVDLERQTVQLPDRAPLGFEIEARRKQALLQGLDEIDASLTHADAIDAWQARDRAARPWIWQLD